METGNIERLELRNLTDPDVGAGVLSSGYLVVTWFWVWVLIWVCTASSATWNILSGTRQCCWACWFPYSGQSQVVMVKILIQDSGDDYWHFNKCYNVTSNPLWQNEAVVWKSYMDDLLWFCVNLCMHIILRWPVEITSLTKCWIAVRLVDFQKALWKKINLKM